MNRQFWQDNKIRLRMILFFMVVFAAAVSVCACGRKEEPEPVKIQSVDDLAGKNIGVQIGTTGDIYASDYEGDEAGTKITRFNKGTDAVQSLRQGKVDCVIIDEQPAKAFIEKNPDLSILQEEFAVEDYAICIAKGNTDLKNKINNALSELKEDGTLQSIIDNYIGDDTKGKSPYKQKEGVTGANGTLTMATNVSFPPYEYYEGNTAMGIDVDMAHAIADKLDMKLEISDIEFDSIIVAVQSGKADVGIAGMTVTEDRLKNIDFTDSYTTAKQVIIVKDKAGVEKASLKDRIYQCFVEKARWKYFPQGMLNTVLITLFAGIIGIMLGFVMAAVRAANDMIGKKHALLRIGNAVVKIYLTIFRGTPVLVQLLIMYYVVFASVNVSPVIVAILAFGLNSAAYVAEAIRSGIMALDIGQYEAGRSLGFTYGQTMRYIILPQAIKNSLPAMCNEFIALLKESSIVGYIGMIDVTKAGDIIRGNTYEAMIPLFSVAIMYLITVMILTALVNRLERRLKRDAR